MKTKASIVDEPAQEQLLDTKSSEVSDAYIQTLERRNAELIESSYRLFAEEETKSATSNNHPYQHIRAQHQHKLAEIRQLNKQEIEQSQLRSKQVNEMGLVTSRLLIELSRSNNYYFNLVLGSLSTMEKG